jgi:hypothetical protein
LDEIISFKNAGEYNDYFKGVKTIEAAMKISEELVKKYAEDFVVGRVEAYAKINAWYRIKVMNS